MSDWELNESGDIPTPDIRGDSVNWVNVPQDRQSPEEVMAVVVKKGRPIRWTRQKNSPNTSPETATKWRLRRQTERQDRKQGDQEGDEAQQNDQGVCFGMVVQMTKGVAAGLCSW